ncbi:FMN-binding protein MioC [Ferrimonas balearica]|uniref:FMN-binding protein MioC n=1 Tax=Ferrimonas balearica TaxID=44012 RepID=UPI001F183BB6|nr:FMN-binding protein MioC [Ferrimonas balearica]MBY6097000.1 FMN-binding protein MioC [Ferrimonas balearica]
MAHIALIIGTTMGGAEAVADELQAQLEQNGHQVTATLDPELADLEAAPLWLVVTSTHGAGELPDNLHPFHAQLSEQKPDLSGTRIALCGIGDSSYDTFCGALDQLDPLLRSLGAIPLVDRISIDVQAQEIPEDQALSWLESWQDRIV